MKQFCFVCVGVGEYSALSTCGYGRDDEGRPWIWRRDKWCGTERIVDCVGYNKPEETQGAIAEVADDECGVGAKEQF